jgi:membrane protease YdiL (CAAX protease family)
MSELSKPPSSSKQIATGALLVAIAVAVTVFFHTSPMFHEWSSGRSLQDQFLLALAFMLVSWLGCLVAFQVPRLRKAMVIPSRLNDVNLSGAKPLSIALAAGIGEELLFRAALQPLLGLWLTSVIFALAHLRTATFAGSNGKKIFYLVNVFFVGVALGLVFQYIGLVAAVLIHTTIDLAALLSLRRLQSQTRSTPAT